MPPPAAVPTRAVAADERERTWSIAEVAAEFGVTHRTGLGLILRGKRLGFPLEEIRTIIDLYDAPRGRRSQLEYVLAQIDERRADLEQRRRDIDSALSELTEFERRCRVDLDRLA